MIVERERDITEGTRIDHVRTELEVFGFAAADPANREFEWELGMGHRDYAQRPVSADR